MDRIDGVKYYISSCCSTLEIVCTVSLQTIMIVSRTLIFLFQISFVVGILIFLDYRLKITDLKLETPQIEDKLDMPSFSFENLDGTIILTEGLTTCSAYLIVYFNSECPSCQTKLSQINQHVATFSNTQILFISDQTNEELLSVKKSYEMFEADNVHLLRDSNYQFESLFNASSYPTLFIYNQEKKLIERINNPIDIKSLIKITRFAYYSS